MTTRKTDLIRFADQSAMVARGIDSGTLHAKYTILNWVRGIIYSQYVGLMRSGVRIRVGSRSDVRVRWAKREERSFVVGQPVIAIIPAEAVRVESGMFRRSRQRWNRWIGRIVLIEHLEAGSICTVKVHGEEWTLKSLGPVLGARQAPKPWDIVNVVVDPQMVELAIAAPCLIRHT